MKKIFMFLSLLLVTLTLVGCVGTGNGGQKEKEYTVIFNTNGGTVIESVKVKEGEKLTLPEEPVKTDFKFLGWYEDSLFKVEFDEEKEITENITLFAKWEVITQILVLDISLNENLVKYLASKEEKENKKTEFFDREQSYKVGSLNEWKFEPEISLITFNPETLETNPVIVKQWEYNVKVFKLVAGTYQDVTDDSEYIESVDDVKCTIDFTNKAVGDEFKVSVSPKGLTEKQMDKIQEYTVQFEFEVVEGYNAYTALDLAYYENRTEGDDAAAWVKFKQEKGISTAEEIKSVILHTDINVTKDDVPSYFFYQESDLNPSDPDYARALGSLKDNLALYSFKKDNSEFTLNGNYFTISASTIKEVVRESGQITVEGEVISHASLFFAEGENSSISFENINIVGNAPRVENAIKSGGIIIVKSGVKTKFYNNIISCSFITFFGELNTNEFLIESCKAYDAFNSFVYNWGSSNIIIKNSELIGAGGPVIIQDHAYSTNADGGYVPNTTIIDSVLESYVTGTEGWFTIVKASAIVPQIKALDAIFNMFGRSFLKTNKDQSLTYLNFICVNKSGDAETITSQKVSGSVSIDDATFNYGKNDPYLAALLEQTFVLGAPTFQSSNSQIGAGYGFFDGSGLKDVQQNYILDPSNSIFNGEYICLYYSGMAIVLGYGPLGQIYELN